MVVGISHAINIRIRELDDEEKDARKGKKETTPEEEYGGDTEDQHAQPQAVQLPEAYVPGDDQGLQGTVPEIILSQSQRKSKNHIMFHVINSSMNCLC